ncbi:MAG TPA: nucleotide exchange factor GrpE [Bacteroidia bacterium]|nr:nucleotide exchange factor GrpE [Bacteroidia bacterium]
MQNQESKLPEGHVEDQGPVEDPDIKAEKTEMPDEKSAQDPIQLLEQKLSESNDKYLRLYSDFDNFRKRSLKERSDLIKTASEEVFKSILPVLDDFERAIKANENIEDAGAIKEGMQLIYHKLRNNSIQKGLQSFESAGQSFDPDLMEAITHIPATDESQKGKVVDEIEKGYKLGEKVIRFAKVVVAQ